MAENSVNVYNILYNKIVPVPFNSSTTAEDICIHICKQLNIGNVARHLFALRINGRSVFLMPAAVVAEHPVTLDFRIRFKVDNVHKLRKIDKNAYNYYFHQARKDVLENKIPDIIFEKYRRELLGLGITDMYREMLEKDITRETVEADYKKFIPKEVLRRHHFFIKKPIHDTLGQLQKSVHDEGYVKSEYLRQLDSLAPEYLSEVYKADMDQEGTISKVIIKVTPHHPTEPGVRYALESKKDQWQLICTIEDIGFISIRHDGTTELSRKNGIPYYLKFQSLEKMYSFISLLDGYYRLTCKWTFNICREVYTPSLQKLYAMKCHGPVGGEFSYAKLESKRSSRPGCFIIRESENRYNDYYIDVCLKGGMKPKTFKLERLPNDDFIFMDDITNYKSIHQIMAAYNDPNGAVYLQECLPPSEYDISPLLLCKSDHLVGNALTDTSALNVLIPSQPMCINCKNLQVYKGKKKEGSRGITYVYRSMWIITKGKKIECAIKMLNQDVSEKYSKDFLVLAGQWAFLQSSAIVRLYGITLTSNISFVSEYLRLGPLDEYLRRKQNNVKTIDLIEAASNLATALWHLTENNVVHGRIRCRKLLVYAHDENTFNIKLADPGIYTEYASSEIHWIPVECYSRLETAKRSIEADVWAFGTTLWEIFMYGIEIRASDQDMASYMNGMRLPQPPSCSKEIYTLMKECWDLDPHKRKKPQAIMRDINQFWYQVYNSRRTHSYAKVFQSPHGMQSSVAASTASLCSADTESMILTSSGDGGCSDISVSEMSDFLSQNWIRCYPQVSDDIEDSYSHYMSSLFPNHLSTATTSLDSLNSMQSVFELDGSCNVVLQGRIGQGFYGEVYKGTLEYIDGQDKEPRKVAVKKLKTTALSSCLQDFEREINIMKSLNHPNIVEILGVLREPEISLVMEFVHHGSLLSYLNYNDNLEENTLLNYAHDIAKGMQYLGTRNIVHRDLAARNILVVNEQHVKISDFGLAQVMEQNDYYILKTTTRELPIKWYAPESLRDGKFSSRSDVWSFGVTMCEMFNNGEEPNLANMEKGSEGTQQHALLQALETGARFPCPPNCPRGVYMRIIIPCWKKDPHDRLTFEQLIAEIADLLTQY